MDCVYSTTQKVEIKKHLCIKYMIAQQNVPYDSIYTLEDPSFKARPARLWILFDVDRDFFC